MKSHFQSSDTTCTSSAGVFDGSGFAGSSSCEPIHVTPPSRMITISGIDQTTSSMLPENDHSGRRFARGFDARNHHANASVARIVGTTMASMMASESTRIVFCAAPTGPRGSIRAAWQPDSSMQATTASCAGLARASGGRMVWTASG